MSGLVADDPAEPLIGDRWSEDVAAELRSQVRIFSGGASLTAYGARRFEQFLANVGCGEHCSANDSPRSSSTACCTASPIANRAARTPSVPAHRKGPRLVRGGGRIDALGGPWEAGPQGGPVVVRHRDCGQPVHVELRCANDHRVFEVEQTESGPRPGLTDL